MDNNVDMNHLLTLENREHLTLTGISDVDSFNEEEIIAISPCGELTIKGELLHIEEVSLFQFVYVVPLLHIINHVKEW